MLFKVHNKYDFVRIDTQDVTRNNVNFLFLKVINFLMDKSLTQLQRPLSARTPRTPRQPRPQTTPIVSPIVSPQQPQISPELLTISSTPPSNIPSVPLLQIKPAVQRPTLSPLQPQISPEVLISSKSPSIISAVSLPENKPSPPTTSDNDIICISKNFSFAKLCYKQSK